MAAREPGVERLGAFSDGVIAVIITIMVLELKPPHDTRLSSLVALWPSFLSYAVSFLFVGIVWANHHVLLHGVEKAEPAIIGTNFVFLFFVSLIPFFTAYAADNRFEPFTTAIYAGVFLAATVSYIPFERATARAWKKAGEAREEPTPASARNWFGLACSAAAIPAAYIHPALSLILIFAVAAAYSGLLWRRDRE